MWREQKLFFSFSYSAVREGLELTMEPTQVLNSLQRREAIHFLKSYYCHCLGLKDVGITKEKVVSIRSVQQSASPHACKPNRVESVVTESPFELSFLVPKYNFLLLKTPNLSACLSCLRQLQTSGTVYQQHFSRRHRLFQESSSRPCSYPGFFFFSQVLSNASFSLLF